MVKVALWYGQSGALVGRSGALVGQSGALGHESGILVWSKWHFDVMQAHFCWLKKRLKLACKQRDKSAIKVPIKVLLKVLLMIIVHFYAGR